MTLVNGVEPCAGGSGLLEVRHAIEERYGAARVRAGVARMASPHREQYESMTPFSWVPLAASWAAIEAIGAELGEDPERLYDWAIRAGVERSFKTVWRVMLRFTSDEALVSRTAVIYAKSRNVGKMTAHITGPGRGEQVVTEWPGMTERHIRGLALSVETVLRLAGREGVKVTSHPTRDGAVIKASWRP